MVRLLPLLSIHFFYQFRLLLGYGWNRGSSMVGGGHQENETELSVMTLSTDLIKSLMRPKEILIMGWMRAPLGRERLWEPMRLPHKVILSLGPSGSGTNS